MSMRDCKHHTEMRMSDPEIEPRICLLRGDSATVKSHKYKFKNAFCSNWSKTLYSSFSLTHIHMLMISGASCTRSNKRFSVLPKEALTCGLGGPGYEQPSSSSKPWPLNIRAFYKISNYMKNII